ncbi:ubiquinone/menaquinone biosynthesis C-methylase UbiE [Rhizobium aquaticum]|uniref:Ubiquinone/menaquinone biosynthesis C-methylase UbiE n=1 Tax=Rhizobium aquaticum TaxID=1549636 RepID=A0ABV2IZQ9_9HYPH
MVQNIDFEPSNRFLHDYVAEQFAAPEGLAGQLMATAMRIINWLPYRAAFRRLSVGADDDVLEVGFGPGSGLRKLTRLACRGTVFGIDRSKTMVSIAAARNEASITARTLKIAEGSFEALPMPDCSVDTILAVNILYFVDPLEKALAEAYRVLKPGGRFVAYATNHSHMGWLQFNGSVTRNIFTNQSLRDVLTSSDFGALPVAIHSVWLPFGFRGIVAVATRAE